MSLGGVLGIAVAQIVLHGPQVRALVGKVIAAGVPEHVRPDPTSFPFSPARRTM
jgi:hypothetical protein